MYYNKHQSIHSFSYRCKTFKIEFVEVRAVIKILSNHKSNYGVKNLILLTLAVQLNHGLMIILDGARIAADLLLQMETFVLLIMLIHHNQAQVVSLILH